LPLEVVADGKLDKVGAVEGLTLSPCRGCVNDNSAPFTTVEPRGSGLIARLLLLVCRVSLGRGQLLNGRFFSSDEEKISALSVCGKSARV
jgi:hypothetical protein